MTSTEQSSSTDRTDRVFAIAVTLKGIDGGLQFLGALLLMVIPPTLITGVANTIITRDLLGDPNGTLSTHLAAAADHFANGSTRWFAILYLLAHGLIKLVLVWALLKHVLWMFPVSILVLTGFVVYEIWRAINTHSIALPIFAALDVIIITLVFREYRKLRKERSLAA